MESKVASIHIDRFHCARARVFAYDIHLGAKYAVAGSRGWKRAGVDGLRSASWEMAHELSCLLGAYGAYWACRRAAEEL